MKYLVLLCIFLVSCSLSSTKKTDLKSPCVGKDGSPCNNRTNVNDWWLSNGEQHKKALG